MTMQISKNWLAFIGALIVFALAAISQGIARGTVDIPSAVLPYVPLILAIIAVLTPKLDTLFGAAANAPPGSTNWRSLGMGLLVLVLASIAQVFTSGDANVPPALSLYVPVILAIIAAATGQLQKASDGVVSPNNSANGPPAALSGPFSASSTDGNSAPTP